MNSEIREIVRSRLDCTCSLTREAIEPLIKDLEAYHYEAMVEAADGALMGQRALDRALGRDASLASIGIGPGAVYVTHGVVSVSCGEKDDEFAKALRRELALGRDTSLDVRPGSKSPGDAVSDYVAGMFDDLWARRDALTRACEPTKRTMLKLDEIIERNARGWQEGETDDERARR